MVTWSMTEEEYELITKIVERARSLGVKRDTLSLTMDISTAHEKCPLKLLDLLKADNFNFLHDVVGIVNNLDRKTGALKNFFIPRYAK